VTPAKQLATATAVTRRGRGDNGGVMQVLGLGSVSEPRDLTPEEQRNGEWRYLEFLQVTS
jgi:hypothetical protein